MGHLSSHCQEHNMREESRFSRNQNSYVLSDSGDTYRLQRQAVQDIGWYPPLRY